MIADLKKVWTIFTPAERRKSLGMLILVILMAMAEALGVLSIMPFLSVLARPEAIQENSFLGIVYKRLGFSNPRHFIFALGIASIALVVGSAAFKAVTLHVLNRFVHFLRHSISARLLSRYLHQPYEFFLTRNPAILSRNVLSEVDQLLGGLIQPLSQMLAQGTMILAMALLILWYDPLTAAGIVAVLSLLYGSIYALVRQRLKHTGHEQQTANGRRYQACNEALGGIKDLKVAHAANVYQGTFNRASREFSRHSATSETLAQSPLYLVEATGFSLLIVLALVLLSRAHDIAHVLPALGLYGFAAYRMLPAAQVMYRGFARLKFASATLETVHRDLALKDGPAPKAAAPLTPKKEIRLRGVRYAYPAAPNKPVLEHYDLAIPANTSLGIAGKSGAGKSTLMDLLLGLLPPQQGSVEVDGTPIGAGNVAAWQRAIGYVPQHIYLADASVAQNIAFGVNREDIDMRAVERAARMARIHGLVMEQLPHGYETTVGDRGIRLAGGQRQRVGVARALYRDPAVLLFDEATSALDRQTEAAINRAIRELAPAQTVVVIAHREASLRACQQIIALERATPESPRAERGPPRNRGAGTHRRVG